MSADNQTVVATSQAGKRFPWFPVLWTLGIASLVGLFQFTNFSPDWHSISVIVGYIAIVMGVSVWLLTSGIGTRRFRYLTLAFGLAVLSVIHVFTIDLINDGSGSYFSWRWQWKEKPDQLLAVPDARTTIADWQPTSFDYPRFLGNGYWPGATGIELDPDWAKNPPEEIWRRPIGAGWSAFAIVGDYAITQEQRGDAELVTCYRVATGEPVWVHSDTIRFDPQDVQGNLGGVGPRATPTIHDGRVYTQGATGIINCLDALTGNVVWSHDVEKEYGIPPLVWGKSGSPLVISDLGIVVVNLGAPPGMSGTEDYNGSLAAFDLENGKVRWRAGNLTTSYASPVLCELAGERQILQINEGYLTAHRARDGKVLWEHEWESNSSGGAACTQPIPLPGDRVYICKGYGLGSTLLQVAAKGGAFEAEPLWNPEIIPVMKSKLSNVVVHDGYVYGLDDTLLQCVELETGKSMWKKRRKLAFGHGQNLLVGDKLLVTTERGELLLVGCSPQAYRELGAIRVLGEDGIAWNNPAIIGSYLLVRNEREAACFKLPCTTTSVPASSAVD